MVKILNGLYCNFHSCKNKAKELAGKEYPELSTLLNTLCYSHSYTLCVAAAGLVRRLSKLGVEIDFNDKLKKNALYLLDNRIHTCEPNANFETRIRSMLCNITEIVRNCDNPASVIESIVELCREKKESHELLASMLIESLIALNRNFVSALNYCSDRGYCVMPYRIINTYLSQNKDIEALYQSITRMSGQLKHEFMYELWANCMQQSNTTLIHKSDWFNAICHVNKFSHKLKFILDKSGKLNEYLRSMLAALILRKRRGLSINGTEELLICFLVELPEKACTIEELYVYAKGQDKQYDYKNTAFCSIVSNNDGFWYKSCVNSADFAESVNFYEFIWDLDNYSGIVETTILNLAKNNYPLGYKEKEILRHLFYNSYDKPKANEVVDDIISKYPKNQSIMSMLFDVIIDMFGDSRAQHYIKFAECNTDISDFENLPIHRSSYIGGYSFAPEYQRLIDLTEQIKAGIQSFKSIDYIDHLKYLDDVLESNRRCYDRESRTEHFRQLLDK
jgi:hypothetical protein